jgi:uncharacterized phiE125 gp8 family phage protein
MRSIVTVTDAADSYDLTVLATVKSELNIPASNQTEDANLSRWIREASQAIATECGRVFAKETISEVFRHSCADRLILTRYPVASITSVTENDDAALDDALYELDVENGFLYKMTADAVPTQISWPSSRTTVVYVAGYELLDELPADIERACINMVKMMRSASKRDPLLRSESIPGVLDQTWWVGGSGSSNVNQGLPPDVLSLIAPYRNIHI